MKPAGIVRDVDKLGRLVIPIEYRNMLGIENGDPVEILAEKDRIIIRRYMQSCIFCHNTKNLVELEGKPVCPECAARLGEMAGSAT